MAAPVLARTGDPSLLSLSRCVSAAMEDIEDLVATGGAPPGFRLPLTTVVVKPKKKKRSSKFNGSVDSAKFFPSSDNIIPGTQVRPSHLSFSISRNSYPSKILTSRSLCLDSFCRLYISRRLGALTIRHVVVVI